jgi:hypothetical protein
LDQVSKLVTEFQLLDLSNDWHLAALDTRLNQNYLVGAGVLWHRQGNSELWYGGTVPLWALIPRAIWPDKPSIGGSGDMATQFTGIEFAEGTSVGVGQVLEFYMNFGMAGVLVGFAGFGFILMRLDQAVMRALAMGDIYRVTKLVLPGLALLAPLGSLLEILVAVVSSITAAQLLIHSKLLVLSFSQRQNAKMSRRARRTTARG